MHMQFTCPDCGTEMEFFEETGRLSCPSCKKEEQVKDYQEEFVSYHFLPNHQTFGDEEARLYICKECGMELLVDNHSAVSACCFCGGMMALGDSVSGDLRPTKRIPFSITEKQAERAFTKWFWKLKLSPKEFRKRRRECKCHAVYMPAWLFQMRGQGDVQIHAVKKHFITEEEEKLEETEHYDVYRRFDLGFVNVPMSASGKFPSRFLEALEPYDFSKMQEFHARKDTGYVGERYQIEEEKVIPEARKKVKESVDDFVLKTVSGYDECRILERDFQIGEAGCEYVWLPVWFVSLDKTDSEYLFMMNGQTGALAFDPPYSWLKILITGGLTVTFSFLILRLIVLMLGGGLI